MGFWRDGFSQDEIDFLLNQVRKFRVCDDNGHITLNGRGNADGWTSVLVSAVGFEVRTDALRTRVVREVLFSPDLPTNFTEEEIRKVAYRLRHKFQDKRLRVYRVAFPIWNMPSFIRGTRKMGDVTLNFTPSQRTRIFKTIAGERETQQNNRRYEFFFTKERLTDLRRRLIPFAPAHQYVVVSGKDS